MSGSIREKLLGLAGLVIAAAVPLLAPSKAEAWWVRGGCCVVVAPPILVAPPPVYVPPSVVYAPGPYYAPRRYWVPAHWHGGYWVPGHWA